jgi:hypothetical protein
MALAVRVPPGGLYTAGSRYYKSGMDNQPVECEGHRRRHTHIAFVLPLHGTEHLYLARLGAHTHPHAQND